MFRCDIVNHVDSIIENPPSIPTPKCPIEYVELLQILSGP